MPAPTTIDLDTELSAVNSILGSIGQSPVTTLGANLETQAETELTGNGSNQTFAIGYSYDSPSQLTVTVNGVRATDYVVSSGNIVFTTAPANQAKVLITKKVETYNTLANPEVAFILQLLKETNIEVQSEGWVFNTESHVEFTPSNNKMLSLLTFCVWMSMMISTYVQRMWSNVASISTTRSSIPINLLTR